MLVSSWYYIYYIHIYIYTTFKKVTLLNTGTQWDKQLALKNASKGWDCIFVQEKEEFKKKACETKPLTFKEVSSDGQKKIIKDTRKKIERLVCALP